MFQHNLRMPPRRARPQTTVFAQPFIISINESRSKNPDWNVGEFDVPDSFVFAVVVVVADNAAICFP